MPRKPKDGPNYGTKERNELLNEEFFHIQLYLVDHVVHAPNEKVLVRDIFDAYKKWRDINGWKPTVFNIDTFGQFIPRTLFPRKNIRVGDVVGRGIVGMKLV